MGANTCTIVKLNPKFIEGKNISFGGELEKEMIETFNTFDILWYAPEDCEKLEEWIAFTNVFVQKVTKEEEFKNLALLGQMIRRSVIITTGALAKKIIPQIAESIRMSVIIYCMNADYHKQWAINYPIIRGVLTNPNQIFENLLSLQKSGFALPIFSYKIFSNGEFNFNYYDSLKNTDYILKDNIFTLKLNDYERFCSSCLQEFKLANLNYLDYLDDFRSDTYVLIELFYGEAPISPTMNSVMNFLFKDKKDIMFKDATRELNLFFIGLTTISAYFSKFPYLYGVFNYDEILNILKEEITLDVLRSNYHEFYEKHLNALMFKLSNEKVSITEEVIHLKFLQSFLIKSAKFFGEPCNFKYDDYCKFPILIKYFMDIDFCLKLFLFHVYQFFKCKQYIIKMKTSLSQTDKRINIYINYLLTKKYKDGGLKFISEDDLNTINETLKIRDFIVVGSKKFHKLIRGIENNFAHKKIGYIGMNELRDYLIQKKDVKYRSFSYFLIIKAKNAEKMFKELYTLKNEFGLILYLIVYNKYINKLVNKRPFQIMTHLPIFIANNTNELINLINSQEYLNSGINFDSDSSHIMNSYNNFIGKDEKIIPKIEIQNEENVDRLTSEDGWELVDQVPDKIFKDVILGKMGKAVINDNIKMGFFKMFKEKKIDFLFNETYCKYFDFYLLPELSTSTLNIFIKHFLYAYTLDEGPNSFYYLMNKDLRTCDELKIKNYIDIISMINSALKDNYIKSYEGQLFRGTKMEDQFIEEKIKVNNILTNLSFWSATKERRIAENYLKGKNILFIIETKKNNIDIDYEQISKFEEKEVLFLPFSKFLVKSKEKKIFGGNEYYEINLEGLDENHERNKIKNVFMLDYMLHSFANK